MSAAAEASRRKKRNAVLRERRRLDRLHAFEERARASGYLLVGGIDEVGRGPLAGPVVAACVVTDGPLKLRGLNDSKQVLPEMREALSVEIKSTCVAWAVGEASVAEIDRLNIYWASILAMERALASLHVAPEYLLTDAVRIKSWAGPQEPVIKGDAKCATVAAASIVAKVHRDALLVALHDEYPQYGFHQHKGYASPQHIAALNAHGPCAEHRRGFWRVRAAWDALPGMEQFLAEEMAAVEACGETEAVPT
ncbi:MAG TPA: ribonuclease HII [Candidatus Elarobacter sp.]|jgi:ribonuclease HII